MPNPTFVAIDRNRTIGGTTADWLYVSNHGQNDETGGGLIYRFNLTSGSTTPTTIGTRGTGPGQFTSPDGILIDAATGDLIVADRALDRIQRITNTGTPVWMFGSSTGGAAADEMHGPCALATDSSGAIYIAEHGEMLSTPPGAGGSYVSKYTLSGSGSSTTATQAWRVGGIGTGNGQFNNTGPYGVAVAGSTVFVTDAYNARVQAFDLSGNYQSQFAIPNTMPLGIYLDSAGALWVAETSNQGSGTIQQVQKYTTSGTYANVTLSGNMSLPFDTAIDGTKAYVTSWATSTVDIFDLSTSSGGGVPVINSSASASGTVGQAFSYTITATNSPTSYAVSASTPLPAGLSLSGNVISGTPTTAATTTVNLTATNSSGTSAPFALTITIAPAPAPGTGPVATQFTYVAHTLTFHLTFSEPVTGVDLSDFIWDQTGSSTGTLDSVVQNDPSNYTLNFTYISGAPGTLAVTLKSSGTNIVGVNSGLPYTGAGVYRALVPVTPHLETNAPVVNGFSFQDVGNNTVNFIVTFDKQSWNVQPSNVTINASSGVTTHLGYIIPTDDTGYHFTIPVSYSGAAGGTISVTLTNNPSAPTISDGNYNYYVGPNTSDVFTIPTSTATAPTVTSATTATATVGTAFNYQITASGSPTSYAATGLTGTGLTLNTSTGLISGTPTAAGTITSQLTATNGTGTSAPVTLTITVSSATTGSAPTITSATTATATVGTAFNYQITASGSPTSYAATGLTGTGLTLNTSTGLISGTPTAAGTITSQLTATNSVGTSAPVTLTITVNPATTGTAPTITSATSASATVGTAFNYQITASGSPTSFAATALTGTGLTVNTSTGLISGTPTAAGTITSQLTATNSTGTSAPVTLTITVSPATTGAAPTITSATAASATVGSAFTYQIVATNSPTSFAATGLTGTGLTINSSTGVISGTPTAAGTITAQLTATNSVGTSAPVTLTITVNNPVTLPAVTSFVLDSTHTASTAAFDVTFNEPVTGVDATDFAVNTQGTATATITGVTPISTTQYQVAFNYSGTDGSIQMAIKTSGTGIVDAASHAFQGIGVTASPVIVVNATPPADAIAPTVSSFTAGTPSSSAVTFTLTFSEPVTGVKASDFILFTSTGLTGTNGTITANSTGTVYTIPFTFTGSGTAQLMVVGGATSNIRDAATNWYAGGSDQLSSTVQIGTTATVPAITSATTATATVGTAFNYQITATGSPTSYAATGLTGTGLSLNATTGVISGTPTTAGTITSQLTATNSAGTSTAVTLTITVNAATAGVPVVSNATVTGTVGTPIATVQVQATNSPTSFSAAGLATYGLSISNTGVISGTPTTTATNAAVSVTATNSAGTSAAATITLNLAASSGSSAPVVTSKSVSGTVGIPMSFTVSATNSPTSWTLTGQPTGISINASSGLISGTPSASGTFNATVKATNSAGTGTGTVTFSIAANNPPPPPPPPPVLKGQTVIFNTPTSAILINQPISLGATATSGGPITYTIISGNAVLSGSTLTIKGSGPVVIRATQAGDGTWASATADATFTANKNPQTISVPSLVQQVKANESVTLAASASSNLPITYTLVSGPATLSGNTLTFTGATGTVVVKASQGGDDTFSAASDVNLTFNVGAIGQQLFLTKIGSDDVAVAIAPDNSKGMLFMRVGAVGQAIIARFNIAADGSFSTTVNPVVQTSDTQATPMAAVSYTVSGTISNGVLNGSVSSLGTFSATAQSETGTASSYAGFYTAHIPGSASGDVYLLVDANGQAYALVVTPTSVASGTGTVSSSGAVSVTTSDGGTVNANVNTSNSAITGSVKTATSTAAIAGLSADTTPTDRLINISSRLRVSGDDIAHSSIAGFVVTGDTPKQILIRAVGPSLSILGINDGLSDPTLQVYDSTGKVIAANSGWNNDATISAAGSSVGAFNLITGSHDAALLLTLAPGAYTAQVHSQNNGLVLVEAYDVAANAAVPTKQLVNISTRGYVGTGEDVLIGGFVVSGNEPKRVLIRAAGPALGILGVTGTLADPVLTVYDAKNNVIAKNDNWGTATPVDSTQVAASASDIMAAENATGAFSFPTGSADSAVIITLNPGNYTAIVSGANNTTGAAMIEVYEIPNP